MEKKCFDIFISILFSIVEPLYPLIPKFTLTREAMPQLLPDTETSGGKDREEKKKKEST